jgi:hypothetical protein
VDVFEFGNQSALDAYEAALIQQKDLLIDLFTPHADTIAAHQISVDELSDFTMSCANKLKKNVPNRAILETRLKTLKTAILAIVKSR